MAEDIEWHFGPFRLEEGNARLWRGAEQIALRPKSFAVLCSLLARAGHLVSKDALLQAVWPNMVVSEAMLSICLSELRRALGETRQAPVFLETVPRRGYRFLGPVTRVEPAAVATQGPGGPSIPMPPPLVVGREAVLAQMQHWWQQAQQGMRHVLFVTGEPGIGKTTLVDAWCARLAAGGPVWVGYGQCLDHYGVGEAYLPVLAALGQLCRGPGGTALVEQLAQSAPTWLLQLPSLLRPADLETLQRRALGATRERMLRELAEAVEVLTAVQPLVLVLEDLHWSDAATLDLLAYLARRRAPARLLLLGTYRPAEVIARGHPLRAMAHDLVLHGHGQELALALLTEAEVAQYLAVRFAGCAVPAALTHLLWQRTDGNPLFLVTMLDYMLQQGWVATDRGQVSVPRGLAALTAAVPDSLRQLVELQLGQLSPDEQRVVEVASVAGATFAAAVVAAGLEAALEQVEEWCAALVQRRQFLQALGEAVWPDGTVAGRYAFQHALYQQVVYERLPVGRRVPLHRRLAAQLERAYSAHTHEIATELARH
jgi:DNA-binding winged helix-turn-helix (wHTH) protein